MAAASDPPIEEPAWLHGHAHDPNPTPPSPDPAFAVRKPDGAEIKITLADLQLLPLVHLDECWIISTGHGRSGPFTFAGTRLLDLINRLLQPKAVWHMVDVISADGFGTRLLAQELQAATTRPMLLSYVINHSPMTRAQGLVRLIVPSEIDDALRQVKWVARIEIR
ncbi:MAG: molybdopterin-dependent oxidoreductase [Chloroflexi bacterium]|nr:molybdopterin-dependent oxidoreductase [Chloroflexota bacterium]